MIKFHNQSNIMYNYYELCGQRLLIMCTISLRNEEVQTTGIFLKSYQNLRFKQHAHVQFEFKWSTKEKSTNLKTVGKIIQPK